MCWEHMQSICRAYAESICRACAESIREQFREHQRASESMCWEQFREQFREHQRAIQRACAESMCWEQFREHMQSICKAYTLHKRAYAKHILYTKSICKAYALHKRAYTKHILYTIVLICKTLSVQNYVGVCILNSVNKFTNTNRPQYSVFNNFNFQPCS